MSLRIATNVASINAQGAMYKTEREMNKTFAQLAGGSRITKAADDAAGLTISENLKSRIRGYAQAQRNANDSISVIQVAEGGLNEVSNILVRLRELGVQAASDNVGETERSFIDKEVQQLKLEVDRISNTTKWGDQSLLNGTGGKFDFQVDLGNSVENDVISFNASDIAATTDVLKVNDFDFSKKESARGALTMVESAQTKVNEYRAHLGALQNRLYTTHDNLGRAVENMSAANSRIRDTDVADATAQMTKSNINLNATTAVLAQANNAPSMAMKLIG